jgi:hypothetical protein
MKIEKILVFKGLEQVEVNGDAFDADLLKQ